VLDSREGRLPKEAGEPEREGRSTQGNIGSVNISLDRDESDESLLESLIPLFGGAILSTKKKWLGERKRKR
jgi:hypothetical protein